MKYKYIGTNEQLVENGFKEWRGVFMVRKIVDDIYVHISKINIQRGHHVYHGDIGVNDWLGDAYGMPIQQSDIQDLIDKGLIEEIK